MGYSIFDETMVDMTWLEVEKAAEEGAIVLLPTGTIEEHGPHMTLAVDIYCAYLLSKITRRKLEAKGIKTIIAPPYYWGINNVMGAWPGSFTFRKETMKALLYDILASLKRWGFDQVFNINWHGDPHHNRAILEAIEEARLDTGIRAYCIVKDFRIKSLGLTGREPYVIIEKSPPSSGPPPKYLRLHAGGGEEGMLLNYFPDVVKVDVARALKPTNLTAEDRTEWLQGWSDAKKVTPLGYFGDPASFDAEAGKKRVENITRGLTHLIESFMKGEYRPPEDLTDMKNWGGFQLDR